MKESVSERGREGKIEREREETERKREREETEGYSLREQNNLSTGVSEGETKRKKKRGERKGEREREEERESRAEYGIHLFRGILMVCRNKKMGPFMVEDFCLRNKTTFCLRSNPIILFISLHFLCQ